MAEKANNKVNKKKKATPWVPGTEPYTKQHRAEALAHLREKLEAVIGKKSVDAQVSLNVVLWEICQMLKLNPGHQELALGSEGYAEIQRKLENALANAVWK